MSWCEQLEFLNNRAAFVYWTNLLYTFKVINLFGSIVETRKQKNKINQGLSLIRRFVMPMKTRFPKDATEAAVFNSSR